MNHYKYNSSTSSKLNQQSGRIFKQTNSRKVTRNSIKNKKVNNYQKKGIDLLNVVFVFAGIFSVISFGLIFSPSFASAKVANAQAQSSKQITIVTNFNSKEYSSANKGKSFLQPVEIVNETKK